MHKNKLILLVIAIGVAFTGCEIPKDPNFTTSHKIEAPILYNKTYKFLGDSTALIDTTSADLDSLFSVNGDNFITISQEEDFEFGDLNDAIPSISVDAASFNSQVGEIEITGFSSSAGDLGSADIEQLTGNDPNVIPAGTPIPAGDNSANPVRIGIGANTDFFRSATIKNGALVIELTNNLGFDINTADIQVIDTTTNISVGSTAVFSAANGNQLIDGANHTASINFTDGDQLTNLGVEIVVTWDGFNFPASPGDLTVNSVEGAGLVASQVQAALDAQDFSTTSTAAFGTEEFEFTDPTHFVELKTGTLVIAPIENELQFGIDLTLTFTDIQECTAASGALVTATNPLTLSYVGANAIPRADGFGSGFSPEANIDLTGCKLYANNNEVSYSVDAFTENTKNAPAGEQIRLINELQSISSSVQISDLTIKEATGIIKQQVVLLNEEDPNDPDDDLDLFNDAEAEQTYIDGLEDLSSQLEGLSFTNPRLSINYFSNIGVPTTIYGAFIGINGDGEQRFLRGAAGGVYEVQPTDPIGGMLVNGRQLDASEMIKFSLEEVTDPNGIFTTPTEFNKNNTNVDVFLNNLPNEIRFIGKAIINESEQEATILDTLIFEPTLAIDIPLAFSTSQAATFTDTTDQDLGGLPSSEKNSDYEIKSGLIVVEYENGLPFSVNLEVTFLDSLKNQITTIPEITEPPLRLDAASVNNVTLFVEVPANGSTQISLNESQLRQLYRTRFLEVTASLLTFDNDGDGTGDDIRVRTTDYITLSVRAEFNIETEVN